MCFFSIIIPVFNTETYLAQCVNSVLSQSYSNFEVLLIDDGSTDNSRLICRQFESVDSRVRVLHQPNSGAAVARNTGITAASGTYALFLDSDDWWCSTHVLMHIFNRLSLTKPDVLCFNFQKYYPDDGKFSEPYFCFETFPSSMSDTQRLFQMTEKELWISSPCNKAVRRDLILQNNLFFRIGITSEDIDWCMRLAIASERFDYINASVFFYRQHGSSTSHTNTFFKTKCLLHNIQFCIDLERSYDTSPHKKQFLLQYISYQFGTLLYVVAALPNPRERFQLYKGIKANLDLLSFSSNPKIKLLRTSTRLVGLRATLFLLQALQKFRR